MIKRNFFIGDKITYELQDYLYEKSPTIENFDLWAIFRNIISSNIRDGCFEKENNEKGEIIRKFDVSSIQKIRNKYLKHKFKKSLKFSPICDSPSCLFLYHFDDIFKDNINGFLYNRYKDPYYEILDKCFSTKRIQVFSYPNQEEIKYYHKSTVIYDYLFRESEDEILGNIIAHNVDFEARVRDFIELISYAYKTQKIVDRNISYKQVINYLFEILYWKEFYLIIFRNAQPRLLFSSCYFDSPSTYGACAACELLNIPFVDIQHGCVTSHFLNWKFKNKLMHRMLPTYYLTWNDFQTRFFKRNDNQESYIKPQTGCHMWLNKFHKRDFPNKSENNLISFKNKYPKRILFIQQFIEHSWNIKRLKELIEKGDSDWLWLYRFHPLFPDQAKDEIYKSFEKYDNVDFETANQCPMFYLLECMSACITRYSASGFEAESYGVPTIFVDSLAKYYYSDLIDDKKFIFCEDIAGICNIIRNLNHSPSAPFPLSVLNEQQLLRSVKSILQ